MVSDKVYNLCRSDKSVSAELARDPTEAPGHIAKRLFGESPSAVHVVGNHMKHTPATPEELQRAFECGKWGETRPSELFLRIYHDALNTLEDDPLVGMVSPSLMGSSGVLPLTIMSTVPDIMRHMANCIARAEKEVILATNYWVNSDASKIITNSIRELNRRAGQRGEKIIFKMMYDRGNPKQVIDNHQIVPESDYTADAVKLPAKHEIPNIDMEVINYHRPVFGTFHSKYMVVDRKIAILQSNNIQDNDNFEMMTHLEGPIVDSFYDMALISWYKPLNPPLPSVNHPATSGGLSTFEQPSFQQLFNPDGTFKHESLASGAQKVQANDGPTISGPKSEIDPKGAVGSDPGAAITNLGNQLANTLPKLTSSDEHYDPDIASEIARVQANLSPKDGETRVQAVTRSLNPVKKPEFKGDAPDAAPGEEMTPYMPHPTHKPFPIALVCRKPFGAPNHTSVHVPQNEAFLSACRNAKESIFIQTPNLNAEPLIPALADACRRGVEVSYYVCLGYNDAGELLPFQGGVNEMVANKLYKSLTPEQRRHLHVYYYVAKDMTHPIHNKFKTRSCHVKLMLVDSHIAIQGNGNQDTQSYFHSQEINIMLDSREICTAWAVAIRRNQNTHLYGAAVGANADHDRLYGYALPPTSGGESTSEVAQETKNEEDVDENLLGVWVDKEGNQAEGAVGTDPGKFSWAKGIVGAVQRVRGAGGF